MIIGINRFHTVLPMMYFPKLLKNNTSGVFRCAALLVYTKSHDQVLHCPGHPFPFPSSCLYRSTICDFILPLGNFHPHLLKMKIMYKVMHNWKYETSLSSARGAVGSFVVFSEGCSSNPHTSLYLVQVLQRVHVSPVLTVSCFPAPTEDTTVLFSTWYLALQWAKPYSVLTRK